MKRLTETGKVYTFPKVDPTENAYLERVQKRLAAYEDTGLEPEEVAPVMQLAEKMSVVDLVRENLRIANRLRHAEARLNGMSALVKARAEAEAGGEV